MNKVSGFKAITAALKDAIREPYAWPGGYAKVIIMVDGEMMHVACAKANFRLIVGSTWTWIDDPRLNDGWAVAGVEIFWEGAAELCCQCNEPIESTYGDPDADKEASA